mmetsp:Transcript_8039/g.29703  ORF Transcript_8039/g.29703 Transcript_8039/m.29703 type:complete len:128 (-) Transcript_8039:902-1285(-)|eukprot:scaffold1687_cov405-Prasinococcus_capsulatus_cf.AAC.34
MRIRLDWALVLFMGRPPPHQTERCRLFIVNAAGLAHAEANPVECLRTPTAILPTCAHVPTGCDHLRTSAASYLRFVAVAPPHCPKLLTEAGQASLQVGRTERGVHENEGETHEDSNEEHEQGAREVF